MLSMGGPVSPGVKHGFLRKEGLQTDYEGISFLRRQLPQSGSNYVGPQELPLWEGGLEGAARPE